MFSQSRDVAHEIEQIRCSIPTLNLSSAVSATANGMVSLAESLKTNSSLKSLRMCTKFENDEAIIAFADALKTKRTLQKIHISGWGLRDLFPQKPCYVAFSKMLQVNFDIEASLRFDSGLRSPEFVPCKRDMEIQKRLNRCGRGRLFVEGCSRADWVEALIRNNESGGGEMENWEGTKTTTGDLAWDCLYWLIKSNPLVCVMDS